MPDDRLAMVVNVHVAIDTALVTTLLHVGGGLSDVGLVFFAPAFFACGAVLPLRQALAQAALALIALAAAGTAEAAGPLLRPGVAIRIVDITAVNALCAWVSHHLRALVSREEEQSRTLAAERGVLLARNEREGARVRALLDVAQHVSRSQTVDDLLRAVCDTTVALVRVPRVEIFLWDAAASVLHLAAARGLAESVASDADVRYPGDLPVVARLRAGQLVEFGAVPSQTLVPGRVPPPFRRGFAAPMLCQGSFEGALFVGYDEDGAEDLLELVQGIARQAALALVNVRTIEQRQEDAEVSRVLLDLSQGLSGCLDEPALWTLLARGAADVLRVPWAVAARFDERTATLEIAATCGVSREPASTGARFRLADVPALHAALARRETIIGTDGPPFGGQADPWIAISLVRAGRIAGFLVAGGHGAEPFGRRHLRLGDGIAHHASIALQNARLVADLEAADRLKSEFVSTMSHELRTPLNVIIGYTEMLRDGAVGPVSSAQRELIDRLHARGRELLELIEATLHVGRLEAGRDAIDVAPIDARDLVRVLEASTAGLPRSADVALDWEAGLDARVEVVTDRAKLALVVRNLVSNALKFTIEGRVLVRLVRDGDALVVEVHDTGIGIREEHLPLIFEMFRQVDGSTTRRHGGVGLGLYIVKQFVGRLGGSVGVWSVPGRGSEFRVVLPGVVRDERRDAA